MARRKKPEEHANHERWLVSYADFITLLFAFFTTMYAISTADTAKLEKLIRSMQGAFGGEGGAVASLDKEAGNAPFSNDFPVISISDPTGIHVGVTEGSVFRKVEKALSTYLVKGVSEGSVRIIVSDRGLVIRIADRELFPRGRAEIHPSAGKLLDDLALSLIELPNFIRVEGHTDDLPIHSTLFPTNWELSAARASGIVRWFVEKRGFPPNRICATGYGEYRPIVSNDTAEGRAANRRVEIVVLKNRLALTEP